MCHGNGFSIRPACCFKLKIYTHTHTYGQSLEYFPCLQFSLTEKFDLCCPTLQLGLGSRLRLSLLLCISIGFVQLSSLDRVGSKNIAHTPHCTFTANRIHISLDLQSSQKAPYKLLTFLPPLSPLPLPPSAATPFACRLCHCVRPACSLSLHMNGQLHARSTLSPRGTSHVSLCCAVCIHCQRAWLRCGTRGAGQSVHDLIIIARCTCTCTADGSGGDCICIWHVAADEVACHVVLGRGYVEARSL